MKIFKKSFIAASSIIGMLLVLVSCKTEKSNEMGTNDSVRDTLSITVLQTADIHGQLDTCLLYTSDAADE